MTRLASESRAKEVSLRTIVWTEAVLRVSGKPLAVLEREFRQAKKSASARSCIWQKYKNGTVVPRNGEKGKAGLVERVELHYPGTAKWFYSPLWSLCTDEYVGMDRIKEVFCGLRQELRELFVVDEAATFWRQSTPEEICRELIYFPEFEGLIALFALLREAEIIQNPELHMEACWAVVTRLLQAKTDAMVLNLQVREALAIRAGAHSGCASRLLNRRRLQ